MPIVEIKGIGEVEFPDSMSRDQITSAIESDILPQIKKASIAKDLGTSVKSGIASLKQLPSHLYGLATGDYDALGGKALREEQQKLQGEYSLPYRMQQAKMEANIKAKEGEANQFATAIGEYLSNPRVLMGEAAKQVPQVAADIVTGFGAGAVGRRIAVKSAEKAGEHFAERQMAKRLAENESRMGVGPMQPGSLLPEVDRAAIKDTMVRRLAPEIADAGQKYAMNAATGLMTSMQAGDVASQAYQDIYAEAIKRGMSEEQARDIATREARQAGIIGGVASFASMRMLPGVEKTLFGRPAQNAAERAQAVTMLQKVQQGLGPVGGAVKTFAGEAGQEMFEEGAGQIAQNIGMHTVAPETTMTQGLGQTMAQAGILGGLMGAPVGAIQGMRNQAALPPELKLNATNLPGQVDPEKLKAQPVPPGPSTPPPAGAAATMAAFDEQAKAQQVIQEQQAEQALTEAAAQETGQKVVGTDDFGNVIYAPIAPETPAPAAIATPTPPEVNTPPVVNAPEVQNVTQETAPVATATAAPVAATGVPSPSVLGEAGVQDQTGGVEPSVGADVRPVGEPIPGAGEPSGGTLGRVEPAAETRMEDAGAAGDTLTAAQSGLTDPFKELRGFTRDEVLGTGIKEKSAYMTDLMGIDLGEAQAESQLKTVQDRVARNNTISKDTKEKLKALIEQKRNALLEAQSAAYAARPVYQSRITPKAPSTEPEVVGPPLQQANMPQGQVTATGETTRVYTPNVGNVGTRVGQGAPNLRESTQEDAAMLAEAQAGREEAIDINSEIDKVASDIADLDADGQLGYQDELRQIADEIAKQGSIFASRNNVPSLKKLLESAKALKADLKKAIDQNLRVAKLKKPDAKKAQEAFATLDNRVNQAMTDLNIETEVAARQGEQTGPGMEKSAVQSIVDRIVRTWKRDVIVRVVNFADFDPGFQAALQRQQLDTAKGFIDKSGNIFIIAENNNSEADVQATMFHEALGHLGLRVQFQEKLADTMRQIYRTNADIRKSADGWLKAHEAELPANYTEDQRIARAVEEVLAETAELGELKQDVLSRIVAAIRSFARRMGWTGDFTNNDVLAIVRDARNAIVNVRGRAVLTAQPQALAARNVKQAKEPALNDTIDGMPIPGTGLDQSGVDAQVQKSKKKLNEEQRMSKVIKPDLNAYTKWVTKLQNDRRPLLSWEENVKKAGRFVSDMAGKFNNIFEQITLSSGVAEDHYKARVAPLNRKLDDMTIAISKLLGKDLDATREIVGNYLSMIHEPERRLIKYLTSVKLSGIADEQRRNLIAPLIAKNAKELTAAEVAPIRQQLEDIVRAEIQAGNVTVGPSASEFNVTAVKTTQGKPYEINAEDQQKLLAHYEQMFAKPEAKAAFEAMRETIKQLNDVTTEMRKEANHIGPQAANIMKLYGFTDYVPFRGRPNSSKEETLYDFVERKFGGELQDQDFSFGGRSSPPENPLMRVMVEGAKASIQLARQNVTQAIYNSSNKGDGTLNAKVVQNSKFDERFTLFKSKRGKGIEQEKAAKPLLSGNDLIYHYMPNGEIAVIKILDPIMNESIRRTYRGSSSPLWDYANRFTSFMGQSHTRYNPAFGIMNYVRDGLTNLFAMYAEHGLTAGNTLAANLATDIATGRIAKSARVAFMYEKGDLAGIEKIAANDPYTRDMFEYLQNGGKVSYIGGLSTKSQMDELNKLVSKNPLVQTKRKLDFVLDRWVDTFEFSSRVAAYRAAKQAGMNPVSAAAYAKNLANFEQIGMYGKELGSLFMFFRQSATGAVRAIDALTKGKYGKQTAALGIAMGFMMYMMSMMMSGDDDEGRNRTAVDDMQRWQRYARFHIFGLEDPVQIPWGFGLGAFGAVGAQLAGLLFNPTASVGEFGKNLISVASGSFSPVSFSQAASPIDNPALFLADTIAPTPFKPLLEFATNVDGLGREIYGNRYSRYSDAYVSSDTAPAYLRDFATGLFNASNGSVDVSPGTLNFVMSSYLDGFGRMTSSLDGLLRSAFSDREVRPVKDTLLFASFQGKGSDPDAKAFAALNAEIDSSTRKLRSIEKDPNRFAIWMQDEDNAREYVRVKTFNSLVSNGLDDIRAARNTIRLDDSLTAQQRQDALKELRGPMNLLKRNIMTIMDEFDKG